MNIQDKLRNFFEEKSMNIQDRLRDGDDLTSRMEAADHIDRLEERCEAYKGQVKAGAARIDQLEETIDRQTSQIAAAVLKVPIWQPIETAPKCKHRDARFILVTMVPSDGKTPIAIARKTQKGWMMHKAKRLYFPPTHWMLLPEKPNE